MRDEIGRPLTGSLWVICPNCGDDFTLKIWAEGPRYYLYRRQDDPQPKDAVRRAQEEE